MSLWGATDAQSNALKHSIVSISPKTGANLYGNVSVSAVVGNAVVGVFGVDNAEVAANRKITSPGWVQRTCWTGPLTGLTANAGGTGYGNLGYGVVSGGSVNAEFTVGTNSTGGITSVTILTPGAGFTNVGSVTVTPGVNSIYAIASAGGADYVNGESIVFSNGVTNATGVLVTNSTGGITDVTFTSGGRGFSNTLNTEVTIDTAAGTNGNVVPSIATGASATFTGLITLGGRAGRIHYETLVAMGSMTGDGSDDSQFPDT